MTIQVSLGGIIPIFVILESGDIDKVIKADIIDPYTGTALEEDLTLTYVPASAAYYRHAGAVSMPDIKNLVLVYRVYEADGTTLVATDSEPLILKTDAILEPSAAGTEVLTAIIDDDPIIAIAGEPE